MTVRDFVNMICQKERINHADFARKAGITKQHLYKTLCRNDGMGIPLSTFIKWLERLDYQLLAESLNNDNDAIIDGDDESYLFED